MTFKIAETVPDYLNIFTKQNITVTLNSTEVAFSHLLARRSLFESLQCALLLHSYGSFYCLFAWLSNNNKQHINYNNNNSENLLSCC